MIGTRSDSFGRRQTPAHSVHVAFRARVGYRWHPPFGGEVDVAYEEVRRHERVYVCLVRNDSSVMIPAWMCDPIACTKM